MTASALMMVGALGMSAMAHADGTKIGACAKTSPKVDSSGIAISGQDGVYCANAFGLSSIAIGSISEAGGEGSGTSANGRKAIDADQIAMGVRSNSRGTAALAIGGDSKADGIAATALGADAAATANSATAIGEFAQAKALAATAIGVRATAAMDDATAIGRNAQAMQIGSVALGANAIADRANTVSVGSAGNERQITNVAAGTEDTDAVNLGQLKKAGMMNADGTIASALTYDSDAKDTLTLGGENGTRLTNLKQGRIADGSQDAVTGGQINAAYQSVANALGGGAKFSNGVWTAPVYNVGGNDYNNVGDALKNLDGRVNLLETDRDNGRQNDDLIHGKVNNKSDLAPPVSEPTPPSLDDTTERRLTNVMDGVRETDAVNVKQLDVTRKAVSDLQGNFDSFKNQTNQRLDQMDSRVNRLGAMNAAMSTMVASAAGLKTDNSVAIGTGAYRGQTAVAVGYQRKIAGRMVVTVGGSLAGSEYNVGAGVGYGW